MHSKEKVLNALQYCWVFFILKRCEGRKGEHGGDGANLLKYIHNNNNIANKQVKKEAITCWGNGNYLWIEAKNFAGKVDRRWICVPERLWNLCPCTFQNYSCQRTNLNLKIAFVQSGSWIKDFQKTCLTQIILWFYNSFI